MTSNAGSNQKTATVGFNRQESQVAQDKARKALSDFLRPEFIGRVDEVVVFRALDKEDYKKIAALMMDELKGPLAEKDITLTYQPESLELIAEKAFGKKGGARDLRRVIRKEIEDAICNILVDRYEHVPTSIEVQAGDGALHLSY